MRRWTIIILQTVFIQLGQHSYGQTAKDSAIVKEFFISCSDTFIFDTATVEKETIRYKLISRKLYTIQKPDTVIGEIILPDYNRNSDKSKLVLFLNSLGAENKINRFEAYQNCWARFVCISSFYEPGSKEKDSIKDKLIGTFYVPDIK